MKEFQGGNVKPNLPNWQKTTKNKKVLEIIDKHASSNTLMVKFLNLAQKNQGTQKNSN